MSKTLKFPPKLSPSANALSHCAHCAIAKTGSIAEICSITKTGSIAEICAISQTNSIATNGGKTHDQSPNQAPKLSHFFAQILSHKKLTAKPTTLIHMQICMKRFFDFIADEQVLAYTPTTIKFIITSMQSANLKPSTINSLLIYPSLAFDEALTQGYISTNPIRLCPRPKVYKTDKFCINEKDATAMLNNSSG